jgi:hypothetical protein
LWERSSVSWSNSCLKAASRVTRSDQVSVATGRTVGGVGWASVGVRGGAAVGVTAGDAVEVGVEVAVEVGVEVGVAVEIEVGVTSGRVGGAPSRSGSLRTPSPGRAARPERDDQLLHLGLRLVRGPADQLHGALLGQHRVEEPHGRERDPAVAKRRRETRQPAQDAHGPQPPCGGALAQVEHAEAEVPQRRMARLEPGLAPVELLEVEQELDLDGPLVAGEFREAAGERGGVEQGGSGGRHGMHLR